MFNVQFSRRISVLLPVFLLFSVICAAETTVVFNPQSLTGGPFPTNALTVPDSTQLTGVRVNLPASEDTCDLMSAAVVCSNQQLLNTLDGFSENPRLMVCFSGPVNPETLRFGIFVLELSAQGRATFASLMEAQPINQVLYDPVSNCAFGKPNNVLAQDTTYALITTAAILDANGNSVEAAPEFRACLRGGSAYCDSLQSALMGFGLPWWPLPMTGASVFTTMSATAWAQAAHAVADATPPSVTPAGTLSIFNISDLKSLVWNTPQSASPTTQTIPLNVLSGVGEIAFGLYDSPIFLDPQTGTITFGPSKNPLASQPVTEPVSFHVLLPATAPPANGYPVLLWGHGLSDNQFGASTYLASTFAKNGFAVLAIEVTGQGYGSDSTVTVTTNGGQVYTEATPGRGVLLHGNTTIGPEDGCVVIGSPVGTRDCNLQTVVDLSAMVNAIRSTGVLGLPLDPNRIYYGGQSEGSIFGTVFNAVEPHVKAAVFSAGGGTSVDIARLALTARPLGLAYAEPRGLYNVELLGAPPEPYFNDPMNDNYVFRDEPPVVNEVIGAPAVQAGFESADWLQMLGDPLSFGSHLKLDPLPGITPKPVLFLYSMGDLEVPNPTNSALIRAAGLESTSWYLLSDRAFAIAQKDGYTDLYNPHTLFSYPTMFEYPDQESIGLAEQQQAAEFLASGGKENPNPNPLLTGPYKGIQLFVIPPSLPERLNYFQVPITNVD